MRIANMNYIFSLVLAASCLLSMSTAQANFIDVPIIPDCNLGGCDRSVSVDSSEVGSGSYLIDPVTGDISLDSAWSLDLGDGAFVSVDGMFGNADPILGFNISAGTGATARSFVFNFSLPIELAGPISARSSVSYSLTSIFGTGARITPTSGKLLTAHEVDTSVGGLAPLNKGVDVGDMFSFTGGARTQNSPVYTASSILAGDLMYDLMSVTLAFDLSPFSIVGISGFVEQLPVVAAPEPVSFWLCASGLIGLIGLARRRRV